ncbi:vacuolar protein sorting-associated protein 72 homolog [Brachyhypopomus gauderio]|uniref:vacuolar protein sorting-associated protein 72 homolog n=1 Tax=Brachyhypopomus gauderio TaxID=698409 RepID=UPI00404162A6
MSVAFCRAPRKNAGNRMSKLLDAEEDDEFYRTTYGGFSDESGDGEYKVELSDTADEVDSDFDIDEGEEPDSEQEEDGPRRKTRVVTKAYKEPIKVVKPRPKPKKLNELPRRAEKTRNDRHKPVELQEDTSKNINRQRKLERVRCAARRGVSVSDRKSVRQSTTEHTRLTYLRLQERQVAPRRRKGTRHERPLTQAELLAEAKVTAEVNLRSLENYERLEADKKKQVHKKRQCVGPIIRYHSVQTPVLSEHFLKEENVDVEGLDQDVQLCPHSGGVVDPPWTETTPPGPLASTSAPSAPPAPPGGTRCSRTYITFSEEDTFQTFFPNTPAPRIPVREVCPVTHKPAVYRDPVTDIPYANVRAFKIIREAYRKYVSAHGLPCTSAALATEPGARSLRQKLVLKQV